MIQLVIVIVLMFVLFFGLGFILNMLMKTTWFPVYAFVALIIGLSFYYSDKMTSITAVDIAPVIGGLIGAVVSGTTIRTLRIKGFKMF
ncbi:YuiB family protein [Paenibacillus chitinolyticus]|uniref:YuiB family protein n=1 Tax=Paenibacillus TaxID=44249 RepID=UPI00020D6A99|nr:MULTISPECIES: YuiB family protein [Paenibacillus]EGL15347.1 hypothetical protein HMPREF9413_1309 [Paenibacillus sp. HGF7]EPD89657.1 hypothetical protein HMPREF1207_01506 [Paenibacillus sp. HGH0039]MBV6712166.1 YuiB family protein [Paenibacillus chitinolyticus]MEC0247561.1 YuiB family protein [Paenibacillus chitinolyticus]SEG37902.1 Putative membrane protein [Paenibacillus sp. UNC499MF]